MLLLWRKRKRKKKEKKEKEIRPFARIAHYEDFHPKIRLEIKGGFTDTK